MAEQNGMEVAYKQRVDQLEALIKDLQDLKIEKSATLKELNEKIHQKEQDLFELIDVKVNQAEMDLGSDEALKSDDAATSGDSEPEKEDDGTVKGEGIPAE